MKQGEENFVYRNVLKTISKYKMIDENEHIVIGLSGGADSVCLFDVLYKLSDDMNLTLYPVHINHGLRKEAIDDEIFCRKLCSDRNLICRVYSFDCEKMARDEKLSMEEAGRMFRYEAFAEIFDEIRESGVAEDSIKIAVAQNADDRAETVLFRLMRGTGTDGLVGMSHMRSDEHGRLIVRPLLDTYRADIDEYCKSEGIKPQVDKTNFEEIYNRNRIRLSLIPLIEEQYNPEFKKAINRLALSAEEDRCFLEKLACEELEKITKSFSKDAKKIVLSGIDIRRFDVSVRRRIIAQALKRIGMSSDMAYAHYKACESIMASALASASANLPNGYVICREYEDIAIFNADAWDADECLTGICFAAVDKEEMSVRRADKSRMTILQLDAERLSSEYGQEAVSYIKIRRRRAGDVMDFSFGHKKLQNLFVDRKIPKFYRDKICLLAIGNEVLAYFLVEKNSLSEDKPKYVEVSDKLRVGSDTKTYISVELAVSL